MPAAEQAPTPRVKICGLRDSDAALVAARAGADYLGFVFVEGVRRQLTPYRGQEVVRGYRIRTRDHRTARARARAAKTVGLFRNQDATWVNRVAQQADLDYVQLCGDEDDGYMRAIWKPIFRQLRVRDDDDPEALREAVSRHLDAGRHVVLDRYDADTPGGSGRAFDWALASGIAECERVFLAGGLDPANVGDAIDAVSPWGVDVSSGVETDGAKDHAKIRGFVEAAKGRPVPTAS